MARKAGDGDDGGFRQVDRTERTRSVVVITLAAFSWQLNQQAVALAKGQPASVRGGACRCRKGWSFVRPSRALALGSPGRPEQGGRLT